MRPWIKPTLFGLGLAVAGLIATNPSFVLPFKYRFTTVPATVMNSQPVVIEEFIGLPDGFIEPEPVTEADIKPASPTSGSITSGTQTSPARVWAAGSLNIPSLDIEVPLVYVSERTEKTFQLGLQQGVVQYPGTALPGQLGNMFVFGHSSDYSWAKGSYKTIFAKLPDINIGSEIKVKDGEGRIYTYKVKSTIVALPTDTQYLSQHNYQKKLLTVQTSYPIGTALKRFLTIAELVE